MSSDLQKVPSPPWLEKPAWILAVLAATFGVLAPNLYNGFVNYDDQLYVLNNPLIRELTLANTWNIFTTLQVLGNYHPLTVLSLAIDYALNGLSPSVYHLTAIGLHLMTVGAVYIFIFQLSKSYFTAGLTALLFGIHPMHLESVAWISSRKDLLYSLFFIGALIAYQYYTRASKHRGLLYAACFGLFVLSLLSKAVAVTLPLILWLLDVYRGRKAGRSIWLEKLPFFITALAFGMVAIRAQQSAEALSDWGDMPFYQTIFTASYSLIIYVGKAVIPFQLSPYHPYPQLPHEDLPLYFYGALLPVAAALGFLFRGKPYTRPWFFGIVFFLITISPVLQVVAVGNALMAERYTYLPYLGLFYLFPGGMLWAGQQLKRYRAYFPRLTWLALGAYLLTLGSITYKRSKVWQNGETLWTDVTEKYPGHFFGYANRGFYRYGQGDIDGAMQDYNKSIELNPYYSDVYNNRGLLFKEMNNFEAALNDLNRSIKLVPENPRALQNRGMILSDLGRNEEALRDMNQKLAMEPGDPVAWLFRAIILERLGRYRDAIRDYDRLLVMDPGNAGTYFFRANAHHQAGDPNAALSDYQEAIRLNPGYGEAYAGRSKVLKALERYEEAYADALKARELNIGISDTYLKTLKVP